jgi:hypothetical protein
MSYHARLYSFIEKESDRLAPLITVIQGPVIHVHTDELVGLAAIEPAREPHGVVKRVLAMLEAKSDAVA